MSAIVKALKKRPILTNVVVYGSLYVGSEFAQQTYTKKIAKKENEPKEDYDTGTLARYGFMGTCVFPHTLYHAYKFLEKKFPGPTMPMVARKLMGDALIVTPINLTIFYLGMSLLEQKEDITAEWKAKMLPTFLTASVFWVPASLINFKFMPPHMRVMYVGSCQLIWVSILCWFKRQEF